MYTSKETKSIDLDKQCCSEKVDDKLILAGVLVAPESVPVQQTIFLY